MPSTEPDPTPEPDDVTQVDVAAADRFLLSGRSLDFPDFIAACMEGLPSRESVPPEPQPEPQLWEIVWASRRPLQPSPPPGEDAGRT